MKKETKTVIKTVFAAILLCFLVLVIYRSVSFAGCVADEYNLKRDTYFSWVTGACTTDSKNGRIYTKALRGIDDSE